MLKSKCCSPETKNRQTNALKENVSFSSIEIRWSLMTICVLVESIVMTTESKWDLGLGQSCSRMTTQK